MHVAICIWGLMRALRFSIHSFHTYVLKSIVNYGHTYDIYVHTYAFQGTYGSARNSEANIHLNFSDWKLLRPDYIYVEDQDAFDERINYALYQTKGDPWKNQFYSFKNHMRALNSLHHVTMAVESMSKHRHYDGIIFVRPDVLFLNPLPIFLLQSEAYGSLSQNSLFLPDFHRSCEGGEYNDRMAMGHLPAGLLYGKKLQTAYAYSLKHKLHAEKFTYDHLQKRWLRSALFSMPSENETRNLVVSERAAREDATPTSAPSPHVQIYEIPFRFRRIRSNGEVHIRDHEAVTPKEQKMLEGRGKYFVGKGPRTSTFLRAVYTLLEVATLGQVYIWNHDDNGNVFCSPHEKVSYEAMKRMEKTLRVGGVVHAGLGSSRRERSEVIACNYTVFERHMGAGLSSRILVPVQCHSVEKDRLTS